MSNSNKAGNVITLKCDNSSVELNGKTVILTKSLDIDIDLDNYAEMTKVIAAFVGNIVANMKEVIED